MSQPTVLVANPSADTYGADLQMLESATALRDGGWRVVVVTPTPGPLLQRLQQRGIEVAQVRYPVLRRADLSGRGVLTLIWSLPGSMLRMRRLVRRVRPTAVYVNTITIPWWLLVARWCRRPSVCHVHEAEAADPGVVRRALSAPLLLADRVIVNSRVTDAVVCGATPRLRSRRRLIHNGVAGPGSTPRPRESQAPYRLLVVGRLSPRKAPDVALEAVAALLRSGRDVELEICGTPAPGQEAYASALMARAQQPDLRGKVTFTGYVSPVWPALARADVLVAPSLGESFGNAVVEAQMARRPVIATAVQGHLETIRHGVSGLLVPPRDPDALAAAVRRLMDEPMLVREMAYLGMRRAEAEFGLATYAKEVNEVLRQVSGTSHRRVADADRELVEGAP